MWLRILVPGRRRRAGLGGLTRRLAAAALLIAAALIAGCGGGSDDEPTPRPTTPAPAPQRPVVLATGLTEANAQLLWPRAARPEVPAALAPWRDRLQALRPAYVRVLVNWARIQPRPDAPPDFGQPADGCLRGLPPCGAYAGLREELQAIAAMQRERRGAPEVEVVVLGVPDWAAARSHGCERSDATLFSRPITHRGLAGYRALLGELVALGAQTGTRLRYWTPWNEPNHPAFVSPQRERCDAEAPTRAAAVYARLVRAAEQALDAAPGDQRLVLGELAGYTEPTPKSTTVGELVAALPDDVACASRLWSVHAYAETDPDPTDGDPIDALERALDARTCTQGAHIWVTETGAGGPDPGAERPTDPAALAAGCRAQAALLRRWADDPRVDAAFQYTFREDTAYPVGLADAGLSRTYPTYDLWRAWGDRDPADPPPATPVSCR